MNNYSWRLSEATNVFSMCLHAVYLINIRYSIWKPSKLRSTCVNMYMCHTVNCYNFYVNLVKITWKNSYSTYIKQPGNNQAYSKWNAFRIACWQYHLTSQPLWFFSFKCVCLVLGFFSSPFFFKIDWMDFLIFCAGFYSLYLKNIFRLKYPCLRVFFNGK